LTPSTIERSEHLREELCLKNKKEKRATYLRRFTKAESNNQKNPKLQATLTKKTPRILPAFIVLAHPEKCGFTAQIAVAVT
jgi:hypothetical protein